MIKLDFEAACKMARISLPEGWMIEIHLEKGISLLGLFPPNGARYDFNTGDMTMTDQMLKSIEVAKTSKSVPGKEHAPQKKPVSLQKHNG